MKRSALILLVLLTLAACTPTLAKRGNLVPDDQLKQIQVGVTTREDVQKLIGTPTQMSTFDDKVWYYIGQDTEQTSFLDPKVTQQKIVAIQFTPEGKVEKISRGGRKYAEDIDPSDEVTPTYGKEVSLMQQLLGNVGHPSIPGGNTSGPTQGRNGQPY